MSSSKCHAILLMFTCNIFADDALKSNLLRTAVRLLFVIGTAFIAQSTEHRAQSTEHTAHSTQHTAHSTQSVLCCNNTLNSQLLTCIAYCTYMILMTSKALHIYCYNTFDPLEIALDNTYTYYANYPVFVTRYFLYGSKLSGLTYTI